MLIYYVPTSPFLLNKIPPQLEKINIANKINNANGISIRSTSQATSSSSSRSTSQATSSSSRRSRSRSRSFLLATAGFLAAAAVLASAGAVESPEQSETLENIPQILSGECALPKDCKKPRIQRPKSRKAESCTIKCVTTCIRGGEGSPGEGPFNVRSLSAKRNDFGIRVFCFLD
ncbi:hypothetical protein D8674_035499 [Pyrus ussuriensis x Pyrus communis]|uniref:Uncharacterized protein n=1 Tax=Pyrus ussuriensis x Pyrus communis TaxID=2448454 RepID=A0A5N5GDH4_9ROSA|nr:hypothetical protein D8674_035499 [Pyrus ussuriensis x Pyrus communis]